MGAMGSKRQIGVPLVLVLISTACAETSSPPPSSAPFREVSAEAGLDFQHFNGMDGHFHLPEIVGSGLAWLDYDRDGDLDLYVVQGAMIDAARDPRTATPGWEEEAAPTDRLYRNDLNVGPTGERTSRFVDVTDAAAIPAGGYGMGAAAGDYNNDGWVDLYITALGENRLLRNTGRGGFEDVTTNSGTADPWWSVSATFVDIDLDGWLDLYVADYLDWSLGANKKCYRTNGLEDYCGPASYLPIPDRLFLNLGDGTFRGITAESGVADEYGAGLGVVSGDFDSDGWLDLYVANDGLPNQLWINRRNGSFSNTALMAGCALNADGMAEASMGIDAADFDEDGDEDLFMAHLNEETNTLFVNDGSGNFDDRSAFSRLGPPSHAFTGFGAGWVDYDNDGWLDIYVANGAVRTLEDLARAGDPYPLHQTNQLFRNLGDGSFVEIEAGLGTESAVSRGSALADFDNDGDMDLAISNNNGAVRLFLNEAGAAHHWIGLRVVGPSATPRAMLGAWVEVSDTRGRKLYRRVRRDGSYASSNDPRLLFGLGQESEIQMIVVRWPGGSRETWTGLEVDRWHTLQQGRGTPAAG
jgi:hypothetical protein